jgi:hypothetical protein
MAGAYRLIIAGGILRPIAFAETRRFSAGVAGAKAEQHYGGAVQYAWLVGFELRTGRRK